MYVSSEACRSLIITVATHDRAQAASSLAGWLARPDDCLLSVMRLTSYLVNRLTFMNAFSTVSYSATYLYKARSATVSKLTFTRFRTHNLDCCSAVD